MQFDLSNPYVTGLLVATAAAILSALILGGWGRLKMALVHPRLKFGMPTCAQPILVRDKDHKPLWNVFVFRIPVLNESGLLSENAGRCSATCELNGNKQSLRWKTNRILDDQLYFVNINKESWANLYYAKCVTLDKASKQVELFTTEEPAELLLAVHIEGTEHAYLLGDSKLELVASENQQLSITVHCTRLSGQGKTYSIMGQILVNFAERRFKWIDC
jgi:hypothetical protein